MKVFLIFVFTLMCMSSCSKHKNKLLCLDDIEYISNFQSKTKLPKPDTIKIDAIDVSNIKIVDSLLIVETHSKKGVWKFYSLNDLSKLGDFFNKGHGKNELVDGPDLVGGTSFYRKDNCLYSVVYDFYSGRVYNVNITKSIKNQTLVSNKSKYRFQCHLGTCLLLDNSYCDDSRFLIRECGDFSARNYLIHYFEEGKITEINGAIAKLNSQQLNDKVALSALSSIMRYCPKRKTIVQCSLLSNVINIFENDGEYGKTICIGDNCIDLNNITDNNRIFTFDDIQLYDDFFVCSGDKEFRQSLMFFKYDGTPVFEIEYNSTISTFDIDINKGVLYVLNCDEDIILRYDISKIINQIILMNVDAHKSNQLLSFHSNIRI